MSYELSLMYGNVRWAVEGLGHILGQTMYSKIKPSAKTLKGFSKIVLALKEEEEIYIRMFWIFHIRPKKSFI